MNERTKAIVGVVVVIAAAALIGWQLFGTGGPAGRPDSRYFIDITTAQVYSTPAPKRGLVIPVVNPDTGEELLYPIEPMIEGEEVTTADRLAAYPGDSNDWRLATLYLRGVQVNGKPAREVLHESIDPRSGRLSGSLKPKRFNINDVR